MILPQGEKQVKLVLKLVENPPIEFLIRARVTLYNKLTFDYIQELQKDPRTLTDEEILKKVSEIDQTLNDQIIACYKIMDRNLKSEIITEIHECKEKTAKLLELLRSHSGRLDNFQLAQLNDLAYRAVQKKGL